MPLHLLGISRAVDVSRLRATVEWVMQDTLAAAVVPVESRCLPPLRHAALLAAIHRHIDVLPVRHGTVLPDEEAVGALLRKRYQVLCRDLDRLRGMGEIGLRVELAHPAAPPAKAARAPKTTSPALYLTLRRQAYQRRDQLEEKARQVAEKYERALADLAHDHCRLSSDQAGVLRLAFLVERSSWANFRQRLDLVRNQNREETCVSFGPWPAYSFV